jgi:hypothetical protein
MKKIVLLCLISLIVSLFPASAYAQTQKSSNSAIPVSSAKLTWLERDGSLPKNIQSQLRALTKQFQAAESKLDFYVMQLAHDNAVALRVVYYCADEIVRRTDFSTGKITYFTGSRNPVEPVPIFDHIAFDIAFAFTGPGAIKFVAKQGKKVVTKVVKGTVTDQIDQNALTALSKLGKLTYNKNGTWTSSAGLIYGEDKKFGNRVLHVLQHATPNPNKITHTVFRVKKTEILALVDEAWKKKSKPEPNDPGAYVVPMGRIVGTKGEKSIKIVVNSGTSEIITAYPVK